MEVKAGWGNTWNYLSWGIWFYCGVTYFGIWRWYLFESVRMISKVKFDLLSFPGCNYFLKRKILQWPYYISPSHYLFGTSSKWYPKENLQKSYKLKYPSWTLQSPFIFPVYIWNTNTFENIPTLKHTKKILVTNWWHLHLSHKHKFCLFIEPTLKNWFLSDWFGPFHQGTKWHMKRIIKTNEKQVYSHFPIKLNYGGKGKGNKHNFVSWSHHVPFVMNFLIPPILKYI